MTRVSLSAPQSRSLFDLLSQVEEPLSIDIRDDGAAGAVVVTAWQHGEATAWRIMTDGYTVELPAVPA